MWNVNQGNKIALQNSKNSFILTMWNVNYIEGFTEKINGLGFILTMWNVNWRKVRAEVLKEQVLY